MTAETTNAPMSIVVSSLYMSLSIVIAYLKRTPTRLAERQTTWQSRLMISGLMRSVKSSGTPLGLST
jgi:hypothetical protein